MFDYISLIFIAAIILGGLIGFWKGGFKLLFRIIILGAAIAVAFLFAKQLAAGLRNSSMGRSIQNGVFEWIADKINIGIGGYGSLTGRSEVTRTEIDTINALGKMGDPNFDIFHEAYAAVHLPAFLYGTVDNVILEELATYGLTESFQLGSPIASIAAKAICTVIAYVILFGGTVILGSIILFIIRMIRKSTGIKKSLLSRLLGMGFGIVIVIGLIWVTCLTFNFILVMDNSTSAYLKEVLHYNDDTWTFAKWLTQTDFGYSGIISNFIK